jgi:hypothetical protein
MHILATISKTPTHNSVIIIPFQNRNLSRNIQSVLAFNASIIDVQLVLR